MKKIFVLTCGVVLVLLAACSAQAEVYVDGVTTAQDGVGASTLINYAHKGSNNVFSAGTTQTVDSLVMIDMWFNGTHVTGIDTNVGTDIDTTSNRTTRLEAWTNAYNFEYMSFGGVGTNVNAWQRNCVGPFAEDRTLIRGDLICGVETTRVEGLSFGQGTNMDAEMTITNFTMTGETTNTISTAFADALLKAGNRFLVRVVTAASEYAAATNDWWLTLRAKRTVTP